MYGFDAWICPDSYPYTVEDKQGYRTWFFFYVTGLPEHSKSLSFTIKNMSNQATLLNYGLRPLTYDFTKDQHLDFLKSDTATYHGLKWKRLSNKVEM